MARTLEPYQLIERSIIKKYREQLWQPFIRAVCDVTRSVSKTTEIERRGGKRWDKPKKAEKSRDCGGGKF